MLCNPETTKETFMIQRRTLVTAAAGAPLLFAGPAFAQFADRTIKFTNGVNEDHPVGVGVKKMQEILAAKSGGRLKINAFWGGSAGGDLQATQALRAGTQEMVCTSSSPLVGIVKELGVFDLPFLFANEREADAVLDGPAGAYFTKKLEEAGLINLAYWENGFRNLTNSKRPVTKVEDFDGVKVRVMQNNIFLDTFRTLGTNAVPMAFGEVFTALETKTIDGQENPFVTIETSKFNEVQRYLSVTRHAYTPFLVLYSKRLPSKARRCSARPTAPSTSVRSPACAPRACRSTRSRRPSSAACSTRSSRCTTRTCRPSAPRRSTSCSTH
jgi:tripartite ATP-independent transporter DctP family solute receptor